MDVYSKIRDIETAKKLDVVLSTIANDYREENFTDNNLNQYLRVEGLLTKLNTDKGLMIDKGELYDILHLLDDWALIQYPYYSLTDNTQMVNILITNRGRFVVLNGGLEGKTKDEIEERKLQDAVSNSVVSTNALLSVNQRRQNYILVLTLLVAAISAIATFGQWRIAAQKDNKEYLRIKPQIHACYCRLHHTHPCLLSSKKVGVSDTSKTH